MNFEESDLEHLADRLGYSKKMRELFSPDTRSNIETKIQIALKETKFGLINCYMAFSHGGDREIILANNDQEARMIFYTQFKKIPFHVSLAMEHAAVLNCVPRVVTDCEEAFALGCQFAARSISRRQS